MLESASSAAVVVYEQPASSGATVEVSEPSQAEPVLESASSAAVVIYEQPATSESAVEVSEPSQEELVLESASSAAAIISEQPVTAQAASEKSESSQEEPSSPAATVFDQPMPSARAAGNEKAPSPRANRAVHPSPYCRHVVGKTKTEAAAGSSRSPE